MPGKLTLTVLVGLVCLPLVAVGAPSKRPLTVADSVQRVRLVVPNVEHGDVRVRLSPDGRRFFIVTQQGDLASNATDFTLTVFDTSVPSLSEVKGRDLTVFRSTSNTPGIRQPRWVSNAAIAFIGAQVDERESLYRVDVATAELQKLAAVENGEITQYDINARGDLVYLVQDAPDLRAIEAKKKTGFPIAVGTEWQYLFGGWWEKGGHPIYRSFQQAHRVFVRPAGAAAPVDVPGEIRLGVFGRAVDAQLIWLSPDAKRAVVLGQVPEPPASWDRYTNKLLRLNVEKERAAGRSDDPGAGLSVSAYLLLDLDTGKQEPVVDAPANVDFSIVESVEWMDEGAAVVLADVMLPLTDAVQSEQALSGTTILEVDLRSRVSRPVLFVDEPDRTGFHTAISGLRWHPKERTLEVTTARNLEPPSARLFQRRVQEWIEVPVKASGRPTRADDVQIAGRDVAVTVVQNLSTPPDLYFRTSKSGKLSRITRLNPQFDELTFGSVSELRVKDDEGDEWSYALVLPVDHQAGRRYPLVIQTHGFNLKSFLIDGLTGEGFSPGYAAQALANKGFVVVQESSVKPRAEQWRGVAWEGSSREGPKQVMAYQALIKTLDLKGLIDTSRIAMHGFSRSCYHVKYALAFGGFPVAAASVADGADFGYMQFLLTATNPASRAPFENIYGGLPFGEGIKPYLQHAPAFQAHRLSTPLLIDAIQGGVTAELEMYVGLKLNHVPTEMLFYPEGDHDLKKPREAYLSQQSRVDWFSFWLNGEEEPGKEERYARWRKMREEWQAAKSASSKP